MPKWIKVFIIHYFILPFIPYTQLTQSVTLLLLTIFLFTATVLLHKVIWSVSYLYIAKFTLLIFGFMTLNKFFMLTTHYLENISNNIINETRIVYFLIGFIIISFVYVMGEFLYKLLKKIKDPRKEIGFLNKFEAYLSLAGAFAAPLLLPNFIFGICYALILSAFYNIRIIGLESYYLSFIINNALPINNEEILKYISLINTNSFLRIIQIFHVIFTKALDLTIIAIVVNYIKNFIFNMKD